MYQAETPVGLCKYKDNEKGNQGVVYRLLINFMICSDNYCFMCS